MQVYLASSPQMELSIEMVNMSVHSITTYPPPSPSSRTHRQPKPSAGVGLGGDLWSWLTSAIRAQIYRRSHAPVFVSEYDFILAQAPGITLQRILEVLFKAKDGHVLGCLPALCGVSWLQNTGTSGEMTSLLFRKSLVLCSR